MTIRPTASASPRGSARTRTQCVQPQLHCTARMRDRQLPGLPVKVGEKAVRCIGVRNSGQDKDCRPPTGVLATGRRESHKKPHHPRRQSGNVNLTPKGALSSTKPSILRAWSCFSNGSLKVREEVSNAHTHDSHKSQSLDSGLNGLPLPGGRQMQHGLGRISRRSGKLWPRTCP